MNHPPKSPNFNIMAFLAQSSWLVMTFNERFTHQNPAICFDSRLYTNMKVQLFVAALIAGNFVFGPPRGEPKNTGVSNEKRARTVV